MTRKLYNEDSMIREFEAVVSACEEYKNNGEYKIILDQTAFFPTGGGQTADAGWLSFCIGGEENKIKVLDGKDVGEDVWHITNTEIPTGTKIKGTLDWEERFSKMQQHTGEHIVSGIISGKYGYTNVGFHLGEETVTMDFDGEFSTAELKELECLANKIVWANIPVLILYPTIEELETIEYRSKMEIEGQVRVVQIPEVDSCACCAPHVLTTGMVGMIKFLDAERHRGGMRITLACGDRSLKDYQLKSDQSKKISGILSAKENAISDGVDRLNTECIGLRYRVKEMELAMVESKVGEMSRFDALEIGSTQIYIEDTFNTDQNKEFVNKILDLDIGTCISLVPVEEGNYHYVAGTKMGDVRPIAVKFREVFGAKGGGSAQMVQGRVTASKEELNTFLAQFK